MKGDKDYSKAKVYKLVSDIDDCYYIGATCASLYIRLQHHKATAKRHVNRRVYQWLNQVGHEHIKIILIDDELNCTTMEQLRRAEDRHIQLHKNDTNCLNMMRAHTTADEKKDYMKEYLKDYRIHNKDKQREYNQTYRVKMRAKSV